LLARAARLDGLAPVLWLVALSALIRMAVSATFDAPWLAPDEMIYGLSGRSWWATGEATTLGVPAPFYGAYPYFVGLPLHVLGTAAAVTTIQCLQAVVMSLTAVVVWLWVRPLAGDRWALAAAVLTTLLPALAYSGLLMSESVFLPAATLALWLMSRALDRPTIVRQLLLLATLVLAVSARLQGLVLVPVLVTAALLAAWFARDAHILLRLAPTWLLLAGGAALWAGAHAVVTGDVASGLGAYGVTATSGYEPVAVARWVFRHAGDLYLLVCGVPLLAAAVMAYRSARGTEIDPGARALAAVAVATSLCLTLQVGTFASRYVDGLAERDMIAAAPPLFACLAVWLARGMPRPQPATSVLALAVAIPAVLLPIRDVATPDDAPHAFMTITFARLADATSWTTAETVWAVAAAGVIAAAVIVPRRLGALLVVAVAAGLLLASVVSSSKIARMTQNDREAFLGGAGPTWVDDASSGPVAYVYTGSVYWNVVWSTAFWNKRLEKVVRLPGLPLYSADVPVVRPTSDGRLLDVTGRALSEQYIVAPTPLAFVGDKTAEVVQTGLDQAGLRLWHTAGTPRLSSITTGVLGNGDIPGTARIGVFDCRGGQLELTLLGKSGLPVHIALNGRRLLTVAPVQDGAWRGTVAAPPGGYPGRVCTYSLSSDGLFGSTRIEFSRPPS